MIVAELMYLSTQYCRPCLSGAVVRFEGIETVLLPIPVILVRGPRCCLAVLQKQRLFVPPNLELYLPLTKQTPIHFTRLG